MVFSTAITYHPFQTFTVAGASFLLSSCILAALSNSAILPVILRSSSVCIPSSKDLHCNISNCFITISFTSFIFRSFQNKKHLSAGAPKCFKLLIKFYTDIVSHKSRVFVHYKIFFIIWLLA